MSLKISEADCALLDAVLTLSFDVQELLNQCQSGGLDVPSCACGPEDARVVAAVHRACHRRPAFAQLTERRLNLIHRGELDRLERVGLVSFGEELLGSPLAEVPNLAGKLWALTTCAEPEAQHLRVYVRNKLTLAGARSLAADKDAA